MSTLSFIGDVSATECPVVDYREPHLERTRAILKKYPEIQKLSGTTLTSFFWATLVVGSQIALTYAVKDLPWWAIAVAAYTIGSVLNHALWVLIHECTHNLVFKKQWPNQWLAIFCNLPIIFPSAASFRLYHLQHHMYQGRWDKDADLARPFEARIVKNITWRKAAWLLLFPISQLLRVPHIKVKFYDKWVFANQVVEFSFLAAVITLFGWKAFAYLAFCSFFSIGLHPLGGRWIQEHYTTHAPQETYSYYGGANLVAFNVGFHNEHHDFMSIPWNRLPLVKEKAPEFYDTLHSHTSWTKLMLKFLFDPKMSLASRITRHK